MVFISLDFSALFPFMQFVRGQDSCSVYERKESSLSLPNFSWVLATSLLLYFLHLFIYVFVLYYRGWIHFERVSQIYVTLEV